MMLDETVRIAVYDAFITQGAAPDPATLAAQLDITPAALAASYERLTEQRALVLDAAGAILMAIPFAATPTDVRVVGPEATHLSPQPSALSPQITWWANCAFDGLGIPAMLGCDGVVETACPNSGAPIRVGISAGQPTSAACVLHMAVPLAQWWDNIADT
jgi:hypothetical protein